MRTPLYITIYTDLKNDILQGLYPYGTRLPSKRMLCDRYGVSVITAEHALSLLEEEGYLEARQRSGCFVSYRAQEAFPQGTGSAHFSDAGSEVIASPVSGSGPSSASAGEAYTGSAEGMTADAGGKKSGYFALPAEDLRSFSYPMYARAVRSILAKHGEALLERAPAKGILPLRKTLASYLSRTRGFLVDPEQIIIGAGSEYLYSLLVQIFGKPLSIGLEDPSYEKIRRVYEANGAFCRMLPMEKDGISSAALREANVQLLHVTPFLSFPSGVTASASKRREYLAWAFHRDSVLIEDDVNAEFAMPGKPIDTLFSLSPKEHVIYMNTFSGTISPSLRVSYMVLPERKAEEYFSKISFYSCSVPVLDQYVLTEFIESGSFERHIARVRRAMRKERAGMGSACK